MAWTKVEDFIHLRNSLFIEIDEKLKQEHIVLPFPQLDIHFKDGQRCLSITACNNTGTVACKNGK